MYTCAIESGPSLVGPDTQPNIDRIKGGLDHMRMEYYEGFRNVLMMEADKKMKEDNGDELEIITRLNESLGNLSKWAFPLPEDDRQ